MTPLLQLAVMPLERTMKGDTAVTFAFVASAVLLALVLAAGRRTMLQRGKNFFANRRRSSLFDAPTNVDWWMDGVMLAVLCVMSSLCAMSLSDSGYADDVPYWKVLLLMTSAFAAYVAVKFILYRIVGWAFFDREGTRQLTDAYMTLLAYNGLMLFFVALVAVYFYLPSVTLQYVVLVMLIIDKLLVGYKHTALFFKPKIGRYTFFLQLCTLEILPCFILYKVLLEINIIFK
ncbi:MAG TPA: DUF4271 domain-containing protein [Candidatus Avibacteroides faecavium]|nr:DUF4271 domain-containing protein [Candidatus Avibacteroides faecavium]